MGKLIYAILSNKFDFGKLNELLSGIKGITGAGFSAVSFDEISAVVSEINKADLIADKANAIVFAGVIENLSQYFALLPMRFGSMLDSPGAIQKMIEKNYPEFQNNIQKVENKSEFGLKIFCDTAKLKAEMMLKSDETIEVSQNPGSTDNDSVFRKYINQKLKAHRLEEMLMGYIDSIIEEFNGFMIELNAERKIKKMTNATTIIDAVFLIEKEKKAKLVRAIEEMQDKRSVLNFILTGPWPPYSFVDITIK